MPRRYFSYPERFWPLNVASTAGASVLAAGLLLILVYLLVALRWGPASGANPWRSRGYEWESPSPPPPENFEETPVFTRGPHEYDDSATAAAPPARGADACQLTPRRARRPSRTTSRASRSRPTRPGSGCGCSSRPRCCSSPRSSPAYGVYRFLFADPFAEASRHIETWIGLVNTIVLVTSSFTVAMGLHRATRGDGKGTALFFGLSVLLALVFLGFKALEYSHHFHEGQLPGRFYTVRGRAGAGRADLLLALLPHHRAARDPRRHRDDRAHRDRRPRRPRRVHRRATTCRSSSRASTGTSSTSSGSSSSRSST